MFDNERVENVPIIAANCGGIAMPPPVDADAPPAPNNPLLLFHFSKKLPQAKADSTFETANKALNTLIILTLIIATCFTLIFMTYTGDEITTEALEHKRLILLFIALLSVIACIWIAYSNASKKPDGWGAMKYPQLVLGMLAIFTYVGVEVTIQSNLGELLKAVSDKANNLNACLLYTSPSPRD